SSSASSSTSFCESNGIGRNLRGVSSFPTTRLRRLRRTGALRTLAAETRLHLDDFVYPLFVGPQTEPNEALPALGRLSVDDLARETDELARLGVRSVLLFGIPEAK